MLFLNVCGGTLWTSSKVTGRCGLAGSLHSPVWGRLATHYHDNNNNWYFIEPYGGFFVDGLLLSSTKAQSLVQGQHCLHMATASLLLALQRVKFKVICLTSPHLTSAFMFPCCCFTFSNLSTPFALLYLHSVLTILIYEKHLCFSSFKIKTQSALSLLRPSHNTNHLANSLDPRHHVLTTTFAHSRATASDWCMRECSHLNWAIQNHVVPAGASSTLFSLPSPLPPSPPAS